MAGLPAALSGAKAAIAAFTAIEVVGTITVGNLIAAALVVNGIVQARQARKAAKRAYEDSMQDRTLTIQSASAPHVWIYGRARVGGVFVRKPFTSGDHSEYLHLQFVLAGHEVDAIEDIWFGDESIGTLDANGYVTTGRYYKTTHEPRIEVLTVDGSHQITLAETPTQILSVAGPLAGDGGYPEFVPGDPGANANAYSVSGSTLTFNALSDGLSMTVTYTRAVNTPLVRVKRFLGIAAGERDTDLEAISSEWKATHLGKGRARIHVTLQYDEGAFPAGLPKITAIVRGRKLYDPRTGSTIWKQNAALAARDYIVNGMGEPASSVNDTLIAAAANICDEAVPVSVGGTHDRYTCDGVIYTADDRITNLGAILTAMCGTAVYSGGVWCVRAGAYVVPSMSLNDDDIAPGKIELVTETPTRDVFNAVRGKIVDANRLYQSVDFPPYASAVYEAEDGEVIYTDVSLPMTDNAERAQRIAKQILHRSRQSMGLQANFFLNAASLQPGDTAEISIEYFGHSDKVFRVADRRFSFPSHVRLSLAEEAAEVYSWSYTEALGYDPAPNSNLPAPWFVSAPTNLSVASGASFYRLLSDGSRQSVMRITWDSSADIGVLRGGRIEVYVKRAIDATYQRIDLDGDATTVDYDVADGEIYNIAVRARNGAQARSNYAFASHAVSGALENIVSLGSITGDRLAALPHHAMSITPDPGIEDPSLWVLHSGTMPERYQTTNGSSYTFGKYLWRASASADIYTKPVPVDKAKAYRAIAYALRDSAGDTCTMYLYVRFFDVNGATIYSAGSTWPAEGSYNYFGLLGAVPPTSTKVYEINFGAGQVAQIPANARYMSIGALMNYSGAGKTYFAGRIQQLQDTELIAPNAATDVLVIRTAGYTVDGSNSGGYYGVRTSPSTGTQSAPDLAWTNDLGETVDVIVRGSASMSVWVHASNPAPHVRHGFVGIYSADATGLPIALLDRKTAVTTPAVAGTYAGSGAPSYSTSVADGQTVRYNLYCNADGSYGGIRPVGYAVSDGQLTLEVIKR